MVRHPRSSTRYPSRPLGVARPENKPNHSALLSICKPLSTGCRNLPQQAVLRGMQLALHATRRTRFAIGTTNVWSEKTRRVPSGRCIDARVYDLTTMPIHDTSSRPPQRARAFLHLVFFLRISLVSYVPSCLEWTKCPSCLACRPYVCWAPLQR